MPCSSHTHTTRQFLCAASLSISSPQVLHRLRLFDALKVLANHADALPTNCEPYRKIPEQDGYLLGPEDLVFSDYMAYVFNGCEWVDLLRKYNTDKAIAGATRFVACLKDLNELNMVPQGSELRGGLLPSAVIKSFSDALDSLPQRLGLLHGLVSTGLLDMVWRAPPGSSFGYTKLARVSFDLAMPYKATNSPSEVSEKVRSEFLDLHETALKTLYMISLQRVDRMRVSLLGDFLRQTLRNDERSPFKECDGVLHSVEDHRPEDEVIMITVKLLGPRYAVTK